MLIRKIKLNNFRQFKGEQIIEFSCDENKNVTIILGNNTFGKTTLLQAFNWGLYGQLDFPKENNSDILLNIEKYQELQNSDKKCEVSVELVLEHKNTEYCITRKKDYSGNNLSTPESTKEILTVTFQDENGIQKSPPTGEEQNIINGILPKGLSNYFFFDTERVSNIEKRDLAESVKGLLGLTAISKTREHLGKKSLPGTVIGKWYSQLDSNGEEDAQKARDIINTENENIKELNEKIESTKAELERLKEQKRKTDSLLIENKDTADLQTKKQTKENEIENEKKDFSEKYDYILKTFSQKFVNYLMLPMYDKVEEFLKNANMDDKGVIDLTESSIKEIIKRGFCICGAKIIPESESRKGNESYYNLLKELEFVPPRHIGTEIRNYMELINTEKNNIRDFYDNATLQNKEAMKSVSRINELEREISQIDEKIFGKGNMKQYEEQLRIIKDQIIRFENDIELFNQQKGSSLALIDNAVKKCDSLVKVNEKNEKLSRLISYAEEIVKYIELSYSKKEKDLRNLFESKVNEIFSKIYHGQRIVKIDKDYNATLIANVGGKETITSESEGLKRVKNFAFISSLVDIAKEKATKATKQKEDLYRDYEAYPLVMDAPFSNTDEDHIKKIAIVLPEVANQVIMFVMEKDWKYAKLEIESKVGKQYQLNKHSETYTTVD